MSDDTRTTLSYKHQHWKTYNHKMSATKRWRDYREHVINYPSTVEYKDKQWVIYDLCNGKRSDPDEFFLIREIECLEYLYDEEGMRRDHQYRWCNYVVDPDTNLFYEVTTEALYRVAQDECLKEWMNKYTNSIDKPQLSNQEKENTMCRCRTSHCYCDSSLTYEINPHSLTVDVTKGKTIRLTLQECGELSSYLATAKTQIKEAKLAALKEQQDLLASQLKEVEAL